MNKIYFRACWLIIWFMSPWLAYAAGLGKLTLGSSLGQPLKAEVELVSVIEDEIPSLTARVASPETFREAGVTYAPYLSSLNISVEKRVNGQPYIQITSSQSIDDPFVNLLIELNWSSGRLLREYTILLDLAETQTAESTKPMIPPMSALSQTTTLGSGEAIQSKQPLGGTDQRSAAREVTTYEHEMGIYGPVGRGETLIKIAKQIVPEGGDLNQMLVALYQANQNAFFDKNMNLLKMGVMLRIPDQNEISAISQAEVNREMKAQSANWHAYRQRIASAAMDSMLKAESKQSAVGRISTTITDQGVAAKNESPEEVLILSKGEQFTGVQANENSEGEKTDSQDYVRMMEENAIAKDRALKEANERVALLEQNVERLQRLLAIKGAGMAEIQSQAERSLAQADTAIAPASPTPAETEAAAGDLRDLASLLALDHVESPETITSSQSVMPEQAAKQSQLPDSFEMKEISDQIIGFVTDNVELVGGGLAALLAAWLGISILRRKRESSDEMDDAFEYAEQIAKDDVSASHMTKLASAVPGGLDTARDEKESLLFKSSESSQSGIADLNNNLSDAAAGFFFGKKISENLVNDREVDTEHNHVGIGSSQMESASAESVHQNKFEMKNIGNDFLSTAAVERLQDSNVSGMSVTKGEPKSDRGFIMKLETEQTDKEISSTEERGVAFSIDFPDEIKQSFESVALLDEEESLSTQDDNRLTRFNLADIKLDLDDELEKTSNDADHAKDSSTAWNEVAVKIDLAKAYLEMDDKEGAREMLEEIMKEGDEEQQTTARTMLEDLM